MASLTVLIFSASSSGISRSKRLFELHHQLDHVQRIRAQVFLKAGAGGHFGFVHLQLLDNDLLNFIFYGHACFSS